MKRILCFVTFVLLFANSETMGRRPVQTYCNPINIDYDFGPGVCRHAADPVVVLFKDKYYLFTTWDFDGYRVSDDLLTWERVYFPEEIRKVAFTAGGKIYTAPAVAADSNYVYFIDYNHTNLDAGTPVIRSSDPASGKWEVCGRFFGRAADPCLLFDEGKVYVYQGLGANNLTSVFELDPETFEKIEGSEQQLRPSFKHVDELPGGYNLTEKGFNAELDAAGFEGKCQAMPCPEGPWMTRYNGRYYLQYATPGTISLWYSDVVMEGNSPTGPFTEMPYNPVSMKVGGFISSTGHSCIFQDRYGNWWKATTMWIGIHNPFERRIGLFPVTFDEQGRMRTHTVMGDYPMPMPQERFAPETLPTAGWQMLSYRKPIRSSSSLSEHAPELAVDEDIRSWWAAGSGDSGEWFEVDLDDKKEVRAIQVNFAEQNIDPKSGRDSDYHAYRIYSSNDGKQWKLLVDKSQNKTAVPHDYIALERPCRSRYLKIENVHTPKNGNFALSGFRVFGFSDQKACHAPAGVEVSRSKTDARFATVVWDSVPDADGYLVHFGYRPDFLNQTIQVKAGLPCRLTLHTLRRDQDYHYRVDAYNEAGVAEGTLVSVE